MTRILAVLCLVPVLSTACTGLTTHGRDGITVYDPTYYLAVGGTGAQQRVDLFVGPDLASSYEVSGERAFFSKHEFAIELEEGMLKKASAKYDTTALLSFLQEAAEMAAAAAGPGGAKSGVSGFAMDLGLEPGIYKFEPRTQQLHPLFKQGQANP